MPEVERRRIAQLEAAEAVRAEVKEAERAERWWRAMRAWLLFEALVADEEAKWLGAARREEREACADLVWRTIIPRLGSAEYAICEAIARAIRARGGGDALSVMKSDHWRAQTTGKADNLEAQEDGR